MTRDEFNERYKDVELKFSSYWKYSFTFTGYGPDGEKIECEWGKCSDDIYRFSVTPDETIKVEHWDAWHSVSVRNSSGVEIFSYWDTADG
jgi:hypothetical protein